MERKRKRQEDEEVSFEQLTIMNQSLCVEMSEKRSKMQRLENKCNRLFERLKKQESLYYCVKRSWTLLLKDLQLVDKVVGGENGLVDEKDVLKDLLLKDVNWDTKLVFPDWYVVHGDGEKEKEEMVVSMPKVTGEEIETLADATKNAFKLLMGKMDTNVEAKEMLMSGLGMELRETKAMLETKVDELEKLKHQRDTIVKDMEQLETERHRAVRDLERFKLNVQETVKVDEVPTEEKKESSPKKDGKAMNGETMVDQGELENMQDQIRALEEQKRNSDVEVQRVKNERDDLEIQIKKLHEVLTQRELECTKILQDSKTEIEMYMTQRIQQEQEIQMAQNRFHQSWAEKVEAAHSAMFLAEKNVDELQVKLNKALENANMEGQIRDELAECNLLCEEQQTTIVALQKQCQRAEDKGRKLQKVKQQGHIDGLSTRVKNLESELESCKKSAAQVRSTFSQTLDESSKQLLKEKLSAEKQVIDLKTRIQRREATIGTLTSEMKELKKSDPSEEVEGFISEIEAISAELDKMQRHNTSLVKSNAESKRSNNALSAEIQRSKSKSDVHAEEMASLQTKLSASAAVVEKQKLMIASLEELKSGWNTANAELREEDTKKTTQIKNLDNQLRLANSTIHAKTEAIENYKQPCVSCKDWVKKDEERVLKSRNRTKPSSEDASMSEIDRFELTNLRKLVKCSVCLDGQKNVILTKCFHMFCKDCIDQNIQTRNRKCPTCKQAFGFDDVQTVWVN